MPLTMPPQIHRIADEWFFSNFGQRFRSKAIFATGNFVQAKEYLRPGSRLINVWPIGSYRLCYSPSVYDLFEQFSTVFAGQSPSEKDLLQCLDQLGYICIQDGGLEEAAASKCEVMLQSDTFGYSFSKTVDRIL